MLYLHKIHKFKENPILIVDDNALEPYEVSNKFLLNKLDPKQFGRKTLLVMIILNLVYLIHKNMVIIMLFAFFL